MLVRALIALVPTGMLFLGSAVLFFRQKTVYSLLQIVGAGCLVLVVLTHVAEALNLLPWMQWGLRASPGHYLDLAAATFGVVLFPLGYLLTAIGLK